MYNANGTNELECVYQRIHILHFSFCHGKVEQVDYLFSHISLPPPVRRAHIKHIHKMYGFLSINGFHSELSPVRLHTTEVCNTRNTTARNARNVFIHKSDRVSEPEFELYCNKTRMMSRMTNVRLCVHATNLCMAFVAKRSAGFESYTVEKTRKLLCGPTFIYSSLAIL